MNSKQSFSENSENLFNKIDYDYLNQSLLTVENVKNILYTISPELSKLCYVTFDYPNKDEISNHKYSIINIKQFFNTKISFTKNIDCSNVDINITKIVNTKNIKYIDIDEDEDTQDELRKNGDEYIEIDGKPIDKIIDDTQNDLRKNNLNNDNSKTSFSNDSIGHFIIIINNHPTCIIYPLYYINCFNLENYLKNDCGFKNIVWNYNIIQHGNSSSCGWECCKIAYDYFAKNNIEVECKDYKLVDV